VRFGGGKVHRVLIKAHDDNGSIGNVGPGGVGRRKPESGLKKGLKSGHIRIKPIQKSQACGKKRKAYFAGLGRSKKKRGRV